jgi:hypothetical protein
MTGDTMRLFDRKPFRISSTFSDLFLAQLDFPRRFLAFGRQQIITAAT